MRGGRALWLGGCLCLTACGATAEAPTPSPAAARPAPAVADDARSGSTGGSTGATTAPEPTTSAAPEPPSFDPLAAKEALVRVVTVHDPGGASCGVFHFVGAIEVEVLGVGEPAPRLGLYVSCPADLRPAGMLAVGKTLRVTLHAKKQSWPKPARRLPASLPIRFVRSVREEAVP